MKRKTQILFLIITVGILSACSSDKTPVSIVIETPVPTVSTQLPQEQTSESQSIASEENMRTIAESFVEKPISELIAAVGEPSATDYASSCLGPGEDGELSYDGFTVYTYREGDSEVVKEVV